MLNFFARAGLRFHDARLEQLFYERNIVSQAARFRYFLIFSALLYYSFFVWDQIIDPVGAQITHEIRGLIVAPIIFLCAFLTLFDRFNPWLEYIVVAAWLSTIAGLSAIYCLLAHGFDYGAVGIVLVFMGATAMFTLRTVHLIVPSIFALVSFLGAQAVSGNAKPGMIVVNALCLVSAIVMGAFTSAMREFEARKQLLTEQELEQSRSRVDELLNSILPKDIVRRIQAGETAIADAYGEVSIVFADLVGFTELSRKISPSHLVEILNTLFSHFDMEAERLGIEKIKTIGDAYMAVGGLSNANQTRDHAERAAEFAFSMQRAVEQTARETGFPIVIRIGLHVGPVVAGVIGMKRPAFDCWGEAVNLASRLEHNAAPGCILISESAYWRLRPHYAIEVLEDIELKGIGSAKAFLLKDALPC